jgi:hypothetical protein
MNTRFHDIEQPEGTLLALAAARAFQFLQEQPAR